MAGIKGETNRLKQHFHLTFQMKTNTSINETENVLKGLIFENLLGLNETFMTYIDVLYSREKKDWA